MTLRKFYTGDGIEVPEEGFIGRYDLRRDFAERVGFNFTYDDQKSIYSWQIASTTSEDLGDWAWVIEGRRGFGKSAFASWCSQMQSHQQTENRFLVALANPDLCANPRIAPLEAALHRLRGQVLDRLCRVDDGIDFGWWSPGEVLRVIAEEAYEKAKIPPRCIVFILDNISILPAKGGERHYQERKRLGIVEREVAALIAEVSRLRRDSRRPAIGVLALAYPGFYQRVGYALRSRFIYHDLLTEFSEQEVQTFLHLYVGLQDRKMANLLTRYSGGIPDLVQSITKQATEIKGDKEEMSASHLSCVIDEPSDELVGRLSEQLRDRGINANYMYSTHFPVLDHINDEEILHRVTETDELIASIERKANIPKSDVIKFLRYMETCKIIETNNEKITVFSEAAWLNMKKCVLHILGK